MAQDQGSEESQMKAQEFEKWNEEMAVKYGSGKLSYFHPNPVLRYTDNKRVRLIVKAIGARDEDRILEVGCGEGYVLGKIERGNLVGLDLSETALKCAQDRLGQNQNARIQLVKGDAQDLPFENDSFDKVICTELLEHTLDPERVVEEIARVCKSKGTVVLTIPNESLINRIKDVVWKLRLQHLLLKGIARRMDDEWHLHSFSLGFLRKVVGTKLEFCNVRAVPFMFLPVHYVAICRKR